LYLNRKQKKKQIPIGAYNHKVMDQFQTSLNPRKLELLESRITGVRVSANDIVEFIFIYLYEQIQSMLFFM